jgi:biotin carboxylase
LGIDGVFTMASDVAIPALAHVCAELGLPGPSRDVARIFTRKDVLREFQVASGFDHPAWVHGSDFDEVRTHLGKLPHELVVKPADTSGSRGVALVNASDERALSLAFASATAHSRSGTACVEELIDGEDVTVEGFFAGGRVALACVTRKFKHHLAVTGHRLPGRLSHEQQERACAVVAEHFCAAGYFDGPFDADLRVGPDRPVVIELSPRLGGNGVPLIASRHLGVDLVALSLGQALAEPAPLPVPSTQTAPTGSLVLGSDRSGRLRSVATVDEVMAAVPAVFELETTIEPGASVNAFRHGGDGFGYALFHSQSEDDYRATVREIRAALRLRFEPGEA